MKKKLSLALMLPLAIMSISSCSLQGPKGDTGNTGEKGDQGEKGKDGNSVYTGKGAPSNSLGNAGDSYIDLDTYDYYVKESSVWILKGNIKGSKGDKGETGDKGEDGKDGANVLTGNGTPLVTTGKVGDSYIDLVTWDLYIKTTGGWTKSGNIKGDKGDTGKDGADGKDGSSGKDGINGENGNDGVDGKDGKDGTSFLTGNGVPTSETGNVGDAYVDLLTWDFYIKSESGWIISGNIKGDTGNTGAQGEKGETGKDGSNGVSIVNTYIDDNGHLICVMSDGSTIDAGQVKDVTKYKVNFYVDDERVKTLYDVPSGSKINTPNDDETSGYKINYRKCKENNYEKWIFASDVVTSEINLYADFTYNNYTIKYVDSKYNTLIDDLIVTYDKEYSLSTIENKNGYTFNGWKTIDNEKIDITGIYRVASDLTLYADWKENDVIINLNPGEGTISTTKIRMAYDSKYELPNPTAPDGMYFKGWYIDETLIPSTGDNWTYTANEVTLFASYYNEEETNKMKGLGIIPSISEDGLTLTYGLYPQTRVSDESLFTELNKLTRVESNGWFKYNDEYYTQLIAYPEIHLFTDGSKIEKGYQYWFKCEPITWNILESKNKEYKLVSNVLLDGHYYYDNDVIDKRTIDKKTIQPNNYEYSDIRLWLNNDFFSTAFNLNDSLVQTTLVDNSAMLDSLTSKNTNDKVYLLSYNEYLNSGYGFSKTTDKTNSRTCKVTDYSIARGTSFESNYYNGVYRTRSPSSISSSGLYSYVFCVANNGQLFDNENTHVTINHYGIRPAITIKI